MTHYKISNSRTKTYHTIVKRLVSITAVLGWIIFGFAMLLAVSLATGIVKI